MKNKVEVHEIDVGTDYFYKICNYIEENINRENLYTNGGTLNYSNLTYDSDILLVAFKDNIPVGYNSIVMCEDGYYIYQIAVKKEYQNSGIGTLMLKKAIKIAKDNKSFVIANVMNYNINSQKMFLKQGFKKMDENPITGDGLYALAPKKLRKTK